jgi:Tfp pilus assembly protein PilN
MITEAKEGFQLPAWAPILIGLIVVFGCGGAYWYMNINLGNLNAQKKSNEFKLKDYQGLLKEAEETKQDRDYLKAKQEFVFKIATSQAQWKYFFDMLKDNMPRDVWITSLVMARSGEFKITGGTYSYGAIGNFIIHLEAMPQLSQVNLDEASNKAKAGSGGSTGTKQQGQKQAQSAASLEEDFKISAKSELVSPPEPKKAQPAKRAAVER